MNTDKAVMQQLFDAVMDPSPSNEEGLRLYRFQIKYRRLMIPSRAFLQRLQNIWGAEFIWNLLDDFFNAHPPACSRWDELLERLPAFINTHPDYSRVFALADMVNGALRVWALKHSDFHTIEYVPADAVDLFELWNRSETRLHGDPESFWEAVTQNGRRGCVWSKDSAFALATSAKIL